MAKELTAEEAQKAVDAMAGILGKAETALERALMLLGQVPKGIHDFHNAIGTHVTYVANAHDMAATASESAATALAAIASCHELLDEIRKKRELPEPGVVALNGGGNGKP